MPIIVNPPGASGSIVTLATVWLNDVVSPWDFVSFPYSASLSRKVDSSGRIQATAGGRRRVIRQAGQPRDWSLDLPQTTAVQVAWLEAHLGLTLCARDDRGHKFFALYLSVQSDEHAYDFGADMSLTLSEVTFSEAV